MAIGSPPQASGSSVPAWPARLAWNSRFTTATAWVDVMPIGLSSTTQPWTSRLSRRGWPWCRCLLPRPCCSLTGATPASPFAFEKLFSSAPSESPIGGSMVLFAVVTIIRSLFRIWRIWCEVSLHRRCSQQFLYSFRFIESFVDAEADVRCEFQVNAPRDLAAQELLVALQRRDHLVGVAPAERHDIDGRELQVRRHPHLGDRDNVTLELRVVHAALRKNIRDGVTHDFADPQLTLRAAGGGILFVMAGHGSKSGLPSSSANGSAEWPPDDRLQRMIQYSVPKMFFREYWMPRLRGA